MICIYTTVNSSGLDMYEWESNKKTYLFIIFNAIDDCK